MTINTLLLDLDGTLVDTAPDFAWVLNQIRADLNFPALEERVIRSAVSDGARGMVEQGFPERHTDANGTLPSNEDIRQRFLRDYTQLLLDKNTRARPYDGVHQLIETLERAQWHWGIVTNKPVAMATPLLETLGLLPKVLICPDHVTQAKPSPEGLLLASKKLRIQPSQAIYVGDHLRDIDAGKRAGMKTIAAEWGYLASNDSANEWQADRICPKSQQLWGHVQALS